MKKLSNLKGAKTLSKKEQLNINGGFGSMGCMETCHCSDPCVGCYSGGTFVGWFCKPAQYQ